MPKVSTIQDAFNAGEFSPLMTARVRFEKYRNALATCLNAVPLVQGGVTRRSGTKYVAEVKDSSKATRLVQFEFSTTQAYILEFGDQYMRVYKDRGQVLSGMSAYEIVTPYLEADLFELKFAQSNDVLYVAHPDYAPRKITRTGHTAWTINTISFSDGPYQTVNTTATTITPSGTTGSVTLTASTAIFAATDVGRLVRVKHSSTWGWATITAFTSTTVVTATTGRDFAATTASVDWRLGLWSATTGYPSCVTFFEDRLWWAGATNSPQRLDGSRSGDYENMAPTAADGTVANDNAVGITLNANNVNVIRWLLDDEKGLLVGTTGGEWIVRPSTTSEALSPTNVKATRPTTNGSANVPALRAGKAAIYVQASGRKVRELAYVFQSDGFASPDMTPLSEHITVSGVKEFTYQQEPYSLLWFVRNDGVLAALTYERDQDVIGWHRHIIGGAFGSGDAVVESAACIPNPDGTADELWLVVKRTINGATKRYVEYMTPFWQGGQAQEDAFYVDCGATYDGVPADTISGLGHLEGETVSVLADGAVHPDCVVESGAITLNYEASVVQIGLAYNTDIETLNIEAGAADGTAQGKTKRIHSVVFRFFETLGLLYGPDENTLSRATFRTSADHMSGPPALFTGDYGFNFEDRYSGHGRVYVRQDQPLPLTILAMMPQFHTQDDGQRRGRD